MNYTGQLIGIAAIAVSFFIYIQTKRYRMVMMKLITDFLWFAHHVSIFSYTAAAVNPKTAMQQDAGVIFTQKRGARIASPHLRPSLYCNRLHLYYMQSAKKYL